MRVGAGLSKMASMKNLCRRIGGLWVAGVVAVTATGAEEYDAEILMQHRFADRCRGCRWRWRAAIGVIDRTGRPLRTVQALAHLAPRDGAGGSLYVAGFVWGDRAGNDSGIGGGGGGQRFRLPRK